LDKTKSISFTIPKVQIERTDSLDIKEMILAITPTERKRLGINKSTLWYQKKKIAAGGSIKVYSKVLSRLVR
jgi:CRISPR-associated protein Cas1